jgi:hypothetical protein
MGEATKNISWMNQLLNKLEMKNGAPIEPFYDNQINENPNHAC